MEYGKSIKQDILAGINNELLVIKLLEERGHTCKHIKGYCLEGDAYVDGILVEFKEDVRCATTNNVFIEYKQLNKKTNEEKKSGISTSKATTWVITAHEPDKISICFIDTGILKQLIEKKAYKRIAQTSITKYAYDTFVSCGYLFSLEVIKANSKDIIIK